ncbi:MAG: hypothetical protein IPJ85_06610 [Flavobacteriales bacterium]|nr:hypothetical protein [Flavobacteriales bacterium]
MAFYIRRLMAMGFKRLRFALLLLPLAAALLWCAATGYQGLNGQDAHDYLRIAREWARAFGGEAWPRMQEHPHGYPLLGALIGATGIGELLALRLISAAALVLAMFALTHVLRFGTNDEVQNASPLLAFIFFGMALSPFLLRQSMAVMSDMAAIASCALAFMQCVRWMDDGRKPRLLWMLLALAVGFSFRLAVAPIAIVLLGWALFHMIDATAGLLLEWSSLLVVAGLFMPSAALMVGLPVEDWSSQNLIRSEHHSDDGYFELSPAQRGVLLLAPVHPGFIPFGIALVPFFRRSDWSDARTQLAATLFISYAVFVGGMPYQNDRVLLLAQPFALVMLWPAFQRAWAWLESRSSLRAVVLACTVVAQVALCVRAISPFVQQARIEREVLTKVVALEPTHVYTHGLGAAAGTYLPGIAVTELWQAEVDRFVAGSVVVAKPFDLEAQWLGLHPQRNWARALEQGAREVETIDGWVLLKVE